MPCAIESNQTEVLLVLAGICCCLVFSLFEICFLSFFFFLPIWRHLPAPCVCVCVCVPRHACSIAVCACVCVCVFLPILWFIVCFPIVVANQLTNQRTESTKSLSLLHWPLHVPNHPYHAHFCWLKGLPSFRSVFPHFLRGKCFCQRTRVSSVRRDLSLRSKVAEERWIPPFSHFFFWTLHGLLTKAHFSRLNLQPYYIRSGNLGKPSELKDIGY